MRCTILAYQIFLPTALLISCSPHSEDTSHSFRLYEENGVTIAKTTGGPKYEGALFTYEKVLEIRQDPTMEESLLFRPALITMSESGNIFISDDGDMRIVMFDSEGHYLRSFGQEGNGPGEFNDISTIQAFNNTLCVFDSRLLRISRFSIYGGLIDLTSIPRMSPVENSFASISQANLLENGRKVLVHWLFGQRDDMKCRRYSTSMLGADNNSLWTITNHKLENLFNFSISSGNVTSIASSPIRYGPMPYIFHAPGWGIFVSDGNQPALNRYSLEGVIDLRIQIEIEQERVTAEDKANIYQEIDNRIANAEERRKDILKKERDAVVIAEMKAYWTTIRVDNSGHIWLERSETDEEKRTAGGSLFRVLTPEGEYLGDTRWSVQLSDASLSQGFLLSIQTDEETLEDIPIIYSIIPAVEGLKYP